MRFIISFTKVSKKTTIQTNQVGKLPSIYLFNVKEMGNIYTYNKFI